MIDTVDIYYKFKNKIDYDICYTLLNRISSYYTKMKLHKKKESHRYITTAFAHYGFLEIAFVKQKSVDSYYSVQIKMQPIRLLMPNEYIKLTQFDDYLRIEKIFNFFIDRINTHLSFTLPYLAYWHVLRIDYAINVYTPYVSEYLHLFHAGYLPKGFDTPYPNKHSFYLRSKNGRINFYDKINQLSEKLDTIPPELTSILKKLPGILRLEYQCSNKYIQYLKKQYNLYDTALLSLWNTRIAENVIKARIASIVGKKDFYSLEHYDSTVNQPVSGNLMKHRCRDILCSVIKYKSLQLAKTIHTQCKKTSINYFEQLIGKIQKNNINPIPLDILYKTTITSHLSNLPNLYNKIHFPYKIKK